MGRFLALSGDIIEILFEWTVFDTQTASADAQQVLPTVLRVRYLDVVFLARAFDVLRTARIPQKWVGARLRSL